ncbi:hypothetical protein HYC85_003415 [Camellia sinensis]|uniref:U2A'/phosphoprotein 32 family A C-terminal domain-containing protein n=1 Tax=Camellia sinensis TaxID=4442 RepID=A0A7J7ICF8_CAMSI|nr:hypothetical protein HYC85_003415 [Camellia sinensis]
MNLKGFIKREKGSKGAHISESSHGEGLPEFLPKLYTLVLTNNQLTNLVEIDPLASLPKLQFLNLLDNNITKKPNNRLYVENGRDRDARQERERERKADRRRGHGNADRRQIGGANESLRQIGRQIEGERLRSKADRADRRQTHQEQIEAKNLFSSEEDEEQAKKEFAKTFVPGEAPIIPEDPKEEQAPKPVAPTPEQIITIKAAIVNSQTLEEVARLEKILKSVKMMP